MDRLDVHNKRNTVRTSVTQRTGLWEALQSGAWRLGPERLSDLPRVTQVAGKIQPWSVWVRSIWSVQSLCALFYAMLLPTETNAFSRKGHPQRLHHVPQNLADLPPSAIPESPWGPQEGTSGPFPRVILSS